MGLSAASAASGGGSTITYVTGKIQCNSACTLDGHFNGSLLGHQGSTCLDINGVFMLPNSSTGHSHSNLCNMFFPSGTVICARSGDVAMIGCIVD